MDHLKTRQLIKSNTTVSETESLGITDDWKWKQAVDDLKTS